MEDEYVSRRIEGHRKTIAQVKQSKTDTEQTALNREHKKSSLTRLKDVDQLLNALKVAKIEKQIVTEKAEILLGPLNKIELSSDNKNRRKECNKLGLSPFQVEEYWDRVAQNPNMDKDKLLKKYKEELKTDEATNKVRVCQICQREREIALIGKAACGHIICKTCIQYIGVECPICSNLVRSKDELEKFQTEMKSIDSEKERKRIYGKMRRLVMQVHENEAVVSDVDNAERIATEIRKAKPGSTKWKQLVQKENFYKSKKVAKQQDTFHKDATKEIAIAVKEHNVEAVKHREVEVNVSKEEIDDLIDQLSVLPISEVKVATKVILENDTDKVRELKAELRATKNAVRNRKERTSERLEKQMKFLKNKENEQKSLRSSLQRRRAELEHYKAERFQDEGELIDQGTDDVGILVNKAGKRVRYVRPFIKRPDRLEQHNRSLIKSLPVVQEEEIEEEIHRVKVGPRVKHNQKTTMLVGQNEVDILQFVFAFVTGDTVVGCLNDRGIFDLYHEYALEGDSFHSLLNRFKTRIGDFRYYNYMLKGKIVWFYSEIGDVKGESRNLRDMVGDVCTGLVYTLRKETYGPIAAPPPSAKKIAKKEVYMNRGTLPDVQMICPLTTKRVNKPVLCACDPPHRFEKWALTEFVNLHKCCPRSNSPLKVEEFREDIAGEADLVKRRATKDMVISATAVAQLELDKGVKPLAKERSKV